MLSDNWNKCGFTGVEMFERNERGQMCWARVVRGRCYLIQSRSDRQGWPLLLILISFNYITLALTSLLIPIIANRWCNIAQAYVSCFRVTSLEVVCRSYFLINIIEYFLSIIVHAIFGGKKKCKLYNNMIINHTFFHQNTSNSFIKIGVNITNYFFKIWLSELIYITNFYNFCRP